MQKQNLGLLGALLLAFAAAATGCAGDQNTAPNQADEPQKIRVRQSAPYGDGNRSQATEERLEQLAEGIKEVQHANCVIVGDMAIVGIDVGGNMDRARVGTIKYAVAEALRKDPVGINAIVTADMDLNHRLQEIRNDMANGRPLEGIAEELADIVGRIVPQLPRDVDRIESDAPNPQANTQEQGVRKAEQSQNTNR